MSSEAPESVLMPWKCDKVEPRKGKVKPET